MKLGMVGLGKMGANMAERLLLAGHEIVGYDPDVDAVGRVIARGATGAASLDELVAALPAPRTVWVMVPSGKIVEETLEALRTRLSEGDVVIDGGNSNYRETQCRAQSFEASGLHLLDCGTSGGVWGLREGYSLMIGGPKDVVERHRPIFKALAPGSDRGFGHVGPSGAGHFVKMVHNGIEYGMMQAFAEGFGILKKKTDLEFDVHQIARIWQHGSVVRSWLLDLTADALETNPDLEGIAPYVSDSGEGRWTVAEAIDLDVPAPVITMSLLTRLRSRDSEAYYDRLLAAMRNQFGGHAIRREGDS